MDSNGNGCTGLQRYLFDSQHVRDPRERGLRCLAFNSNAYDRRLGCVCRSQNRMKVGIECNNPSLLLRCDRDELDIAGLGKSDFGSVTGINPGLA